MKTTPRVEEWRRRGERHEFRGHGIHVFRRDGAGAVLPRGRRTTPGQDGGGAGEAGAAGAAAGPTLLLLHGFPSSSFDWRGLLEHLPGDRPVLAFDDLGFGLSDKPRDHTYSLFWQADLAEDVVRAYANGGPVFLVGHDMGTSIATELMARDIEGTAKIETSGGLLFNGSILLHRASPRPAQKLLRSPAGPVFARLMNERAFRRSFAELFSPDHPLTDEEAADQWALIVHGNGTRIAHKTIHYMTERETFTDRWHGAVRDWPKPLSFAWGLLDPVATTSVLEGLIELRPHAPVTRLPDLGHYPQVEAPEEIAKALDQALAATLAP